jgi:hypothetical protein
MKTDLSSDSEERKSNQELVGGRAAAISRLRSSAPAFTDRRGRMHTAGI